MKLKSLLFGILILLTAHSVAAQTPTPGPYATMCQTCTAQLAVTAVAGHVALPSANTAYSALTLYNAGTKDLFWTLGDTTTNATVSNNRLPAGLQTVVYANGNTFVSAITGGSDTSTLDVFQANGPLGLLVPGGGSGGGGTSPGGATTQVQFNSSGVFAGDAGLTYAGNGRLTVTNSTANTTALTINGGTQTANAPAVSLSQTWNNSGIAFTGLLLNISKTAASASSKIFDFQRDATTALSLDQDGSALNFGSFTGNLMSITERGSWVVGGNAGGTNLSSIVSFNGATRDVVISRLASTRLGVSQSTNAAEFDVFSTTDSSTSPTNSAYAYLKAGATAGEFDLGSTHTGTGTGLTKFGLLVDGTVRADYGVTLAGSWTFTGGGVVSSTNVIANTFVEATTAIITATTAGYISFGNSDNSMCRAAAGVIEINTVASCGAAGSLKAANLQAGIVYSAAGTALPSCTGLNGTRAFVSDSTVSAYGTAYTSGGANNEPVFCNGTNWIIGQIANDNMKDIA